MPMLLTSTPALDQVDVEKPLSPSASVTVKTDKEPARNQRGVEVAKAETALGKGALPEGFFDNKEADLRARGIEPVKPDVKDEYKEFEKLIQEDLQELDNRMEEEEIDAAEMIEEEVMIEQKTCTEIVELMKRMHMELIAARSSEGNGDSEVEAKKPGQDGSYSSSDDDDDDDDDDGEESFTVDWRAQHL